MTVNGIPHFHNRPGVPQVRIGAKKFMCIGDLPPFDHPHIFIDMGDDNEIVCPYCSTLFVYDPRLEGGFVYDPRLEGGCEPAECAYRPETVPELTPPAADIGVVTAVPNPPLPKAVETWAVKVNDVNHTYGEVHEMVHRDISIGNDYRKERVKHVTTLAAGVFAITVTFHKDMFGGHVTVGALIFLVLGWLMLVGSLLSGIFHFQAWENYYLAFRDVGNSLWKYRVETDAAAKNRARAAVYAARNNVQELQTRYRRWNFFQTWGLVFGLIFIVVYVVLSSRTLVETPPSAGRREQPTAKESSATSPITNPSVQAPPAPQRPEPPPAQPAPALPPATNPSR